MVQENILSQEMLVPLGSCSPRHTPATVSLKQFKISDIDTLELPFFDDFSYNGNLPNTDLWIDDYVYINNNYSGNPVSIGVATLDAVNSEGKLNGETSSPFISDYLTSLPINLDYPDRNDIYLSFFYQPQGLGDNPETWDSLCVDFYAPNADEWHTVWSTPGRESEKFTQVFIQVNDTSFLKPGFRFRFKNYASLPKSLSYPSFNSNVDHWNIDYVYLDKGRAPEITAINDVSMITSIHSLLKSYEAIPWRHFPGAYQTEIKPTVSISYRNNDTLTRNVTRILEITDLRIGKNITINGGAVNVSAGELVTFDLPFNFPFVYYNKDSTEFEVKAYLETDEMDFKWNDTVINIQKFYNYYAYDDASAEMGYGLSGEGTINAAVAYQFETFKKDTLRGVKMYFNQTLDNISQDYFMLSVWNHIKETNEPGELIYSMPGPKPEYGDQLNKFITYEFDTVIIVADFFYVGWIKTTEDLLNVGFDRNINNQPRIFYNLGQEWTNTAYQGSLMIRPIVGREIEWPAGQEKHNDLQFKIFPNPANDWLYFDFNTRDYSFTHQLTIFDMQGRKIIHTILKDRKIDVSSLQNGFYLLRISDHNGSYHTKRLLISR